MKVLWQWMFSLLRENVTKSKKGVHQSMFCSLDHVSLVSPPGSCHRLDTPSIVITTPGLGKGGSTPCLNTRFIPELCNMAIKFYFTWFLRQKCLLIGSVINHFAKNLFSKTFFLWGVRRKPLIKQFSAILSLYKLNVKKKMWRYPNLAPTHYYFKL